MKMFGQGCSTPLTMSRLYHLFFLTSSQVELYRFQIFDAQVNTLLIHRLCNKSSRISSTYITDEQQVQLLHGVIRFGDSF